MKTIVVLPAFNAADTLERTWEAIPKHLVDEVILVDDASTDGTLAVAAGLPGLHVVRHPRNRGYGGNQKTCYDEALERGAAIVVMLHPDFQYDPANISGMIGPIRDGECDMVIGSRFMTEDPRKNGMHWWRYYGNRLLTFLQNLALGTHLSECHSGYRAYSRTLLENVPYHAFSDRFAFDSQMIASVARKGFRIGEEPISARYFPDSSSITFGSSVRYGLSTLLTLLH